MIGQLQIYTCYSFQNSTILIEDLCKRAKELQYEALCITDKNNMYGTYEFYKCACKYGIKPVIGAEISVMYQDDICPLLVIAKNQEGYHNLMKIISIICTRTPQYITLDELSLYHDLYVLSAFKEGFIERQVLRDVNKTDAANAFKESMNLITMMKQKFANNFYICVQNHGSSMQRQLNTALISLAELARVKVCASNEVRYLYPEHSLTLDLLQASNRNETLPLNYEPVTNQKYLKSKEQMDHLFNEEIIYNTDHILRHAFVSLNPVTPKLPKYPVPGNGSSYDYLKQLCIVGIKKRCQHKVPKKYQERLLHELDVIHKMQFDDYFLIVFDYVRFAKNQGIYVGPGRGSAAGSLVAYSLGITNVDPIAYDLLFERFLNEDRVSMPDIDIDFQDDRRDEVVEYVKGKYGEDHVAQIVTFSTYGPKVAIKDLGKVMSVPAPKLELMAKQVPTNPKNRKSAKEVYETSYYFKNMIDKEPAMVKIIDSIFITEKLLRNISTHAAGVVLSKDPLDTLVPLTTGPSEWIVTQYSKDYIEEAGLLKMDFLGLRNLTMIHQICNDIEENKKIKINLNTIPLNDKKTFDLISNVDTFGVFQLESNGMKNLLSKMKCDCFDDIVASIALFRPGPMANIPAYVARKHGEEKVEYVDQRLEPVLKSTYGIMIYQEQIMLSAGIVAGFSMSKADSLRKAMSKKNAAMIASMKDEFVEGAVSNGYQKEKAIEIYELIEKFANYGFNKSHSVAYGMICYQMAYLKANYPIEFFSAILSNDQGSVSHKLTCIQEGRKYGLDILPPSINYSNNLFKIEGNHLRYSLISIKGVGYAGYQAIMNERKNGKFTDIYDFIARMQKTSMNHKMLESLIDAGAFDEFHINRTTLRMHLKEIEEYAVMKDSLVVDVPPILEIVKDQPYEILNREKEVLGIYLTKHPIELMKEKLPEGSIVDVMNLENYNSKTVIVLVMLSRVRTIVDKRGNDMCFIGGEDDTGSMEGVVFSSVYDKYKELLEKGNIVLVEGTVEVKDRISFRVRRIKRYG